MSGPQRSRRAPRQTPKRRLALAAGLTVVTVGAVLAQALLGRSRPDPPVAALRATSPRLAPLKHARSVRLAEHTFGSLTGPLQDVAAVALAPGQVMLLGGLSATDTSLADVRIVNTHGDHRVGSLPVALHDTAAVRLGSAVYVFGGGTNAGTQSDAIVRVPIRSGTATEIGRLPAQSSDQAAAAIGRTAYVVGGYTGRRWLNTVVAWHPGSKARVVARLPFTLRYAAVTAVGRTLVIAGGSLENDTASSAILSYTPEHGLRRIGRLPAATTHAAAAAIGDVAYVIGGRGASKGSVVDSIVSIDLRTHTIHAAGALAFARSDLAAVSLGTRILLAGGRDSNGAVANLSELVPATSRQTQVATSVQSVYSLDGADRLTGPARFAKALVYVPNSQSASVDVIDPHTYKVVGHFAVGQLPQHVVPSYDLKTLYVTNDVGNSLTVLNPRTGKPVRTIPVDDPYNMYFTPDGRYAIVVAERLRRLDFRNPHTFALHHTLPVPCSGVDHMDFSADGRYLIASCEFSGQVVKVDLASERVVGVRDLPDGSGGMPQDVRVSPDGKLFYVADLTAGGVWKIDGGTLKVIGFVRTGAGAHGLYPSRNGKNLYVSNRSDGSVSVISFRLQKVVKTWRIPGGGSPDMGGVSADGKVLWLSGRYNSDVYAISTKTGQLLARIPVGAGPHGLCVWPQPGRYSLGHTDNMR
jgi:DNA-binding beta-propeller fold protein YncE